MFTENNRANNKSAGQDNFSRVFERYASKMKEVIADFLNATLTTVILPDDWVVSVICPLIPITIGTFSF